MLNNVHLFYLLFINYEYLVKVLSMMINTYYNIIFNTNNMLLAYLT